MASHGSDGRRVFISYAQENERQRNLVREFAYFLRKQGINVRLDQDVEDDRQDWMSWCPDEIRAAERVLVVVSPSYRTRFEGTGPISQGRGVQIEGILIKEEIQRDHRAALRKYLPVLIGDARVDDIPDLLQPYSSTHYEVRDFTPQAADRLLRVLCRRPTRPEPSEPRVVADPQPSPKAALRLAASGGPRLEVDRLIQGLLSVDTVAGDSGADSRFDGAFVVGPPPSILEALERGVRTIEEHLASWNARRHGERLIARIGGHLATRVDEAVHGATSLANCAAACRMHSVSDSHLVLAMSSEFYHELSRVQTYPRATAYREWPIESDAGSTCWLAVPGRTQCPDLPAEPKMAIAATESLDSGRAARVSITDNKGQVIYNERDAQISIVNHYGGSK